MSPAEVLHRLRDAGATQYLKIERRWRFRPGRRIHWRDFAFCAGAEAQLPPLKYSFDPSASDAQRLLNGDWGALGFAWRWQPNEAALWHLAPDTARRWPLKFFDSIAYRTGNPYGDARVVWEPSRLQTLVQLALLAKRDAHHRKRAVELLEQVLADWFAKNPYALGIHYVSAMECALRLIAVCHALDMTRRLLKHRDATWSALIGLMESHATLIARRVSRHSSAGNHSIAEGVGLVYAGVLFPEHRHAVHWRKAGLKLLAAEALRQVLPDGGGIEQAFWYQLFIVDLLGLAQALLEHQHEPVPPPISAAVERGRRFLNAWGREAAELPNIGDSDGGYALTPHLRISFELGKPDEIRLFPNAGYTVCHLEADARLRVIVDHGALGMPPSCGHGHADALSVLMSSGGIDLLIDPGTYGYNLGAEWRRYFKSTRAHNTVTVDGRDQARQESAFLWSGAYEAQLVEPPRGAGEILTRLVARHDGYLHLNVIHSRTIALHRNGLLIVHDRLEGQGEHELELNWHFGVQSVVFSPDANELHCPTGHRLKIFGGACTLQHGWQSQNYGSKKQIPVARTVWRGRLPHQFATFIVPNGVEVDFESHLDK